MTQKKSSVGPVQYVILGAVVLVAAAGGMMLGGKFGLAASDDDPVDMAVFTQLSLKPGMDMPSVELTDRFYKLHSTDDLLHPQGTVVLFTDDDCAPCTEMVPRWQQMIEGGILEPEQIVGITFDDAVTIEDVVTKYGIDFSIYADETYAYLNDYGIDGYPLIVLIDGGGVIRKIEADGRREFAPRELQAFLNPY